MTGYHAAVMVLALLNVVSIALCVLMGGRLQRLEREVALRSAAVAAPAGVQNAEAPASPASEKFSAALLGGEMNLKLAGNHDLREPPEKYRFIAALDKQGMGAEEIARVLHLAPGEVSQLLTLSRLGQARSGGDEKAKE